MPNQDMFDYSDSTVIQDSFYESNLNFGHFMHHIFFNPDRKDEAAWDILGGKPSCVYS